MVSKKAVGFLKRPGPAGQRIRTDVRTRDAFCLVQSCFGSRKFPSEHDCGNRVSSTRCNGRSPRGILSSSLCTTSLLPPSKLQTQSFQNSPITACASVLFLWCPIIIIRGSSQKTSNLCHGSEVLEADGHEIVIHGYFHERPRRAKETLRDKFLTRFYTQNEGEFYDLGYDEALRRIVAATR